jgi:hypothetical protein
MKPLTKNRAYVGKRTDLFEKHAKDLNPYRAFVMVGYGWADVFSGSVSVPKWTVHRNSGVTHAAHQKPRFGRVVRHRHAPVGVCHAWAGNEPSDDERHGE